MTSERGQTKIVGLPLFGSSKFGFHKKCSIFVKCKTENSKT